MTCPSCNVAFHDTWKEVYLTPQPANAFMAVVGVHWKAQWQTCPTCNQMVIAIDRFEGFPPGGQELMKRENWLVFPLPGLRPVSKLIPETYRREFQEACQVLPTSPKASAALSRRCLQLLLRECAKVTRSNLAAEIDEVLQRKELPSHLAEAVDAVRIYGNFAAHPTKSENTGAIIDVEPGEAEWLLEVLEGLFDFYILQPAKLKARQEQLKAKMESAKKTARPPSKGRRLRPSTPLPAPQTEQN